MRTERLPQSLRPSHGFTLIEVLVALAVLAIALSAILRAVGSAVDTAIALRDHTEAMWVAENRVAIHQIRRDWLPVSVQNGSETEGHRRWRWRETVESTPLAGFRRVNVRVHAPKSTHQLARLVGFLRKPS